MDNPGPVPSETYRSKTHNVFPSPLGGLGVPGQEDVLLSPAPMHMSPLRGETGGSEEVKLDHRRDTAVWEKEEGRDKKSGRTRLKSKDKTNIDKETGRAQEIPPLRVRG